MRGRSSLFVGVFVLLQGCDSQWGAKMTLDQRMTMIHPNTALGLLDRIERLEEFYFAVRNLHGHTDLEEALSCRLCKAMEVAKEALRGEGGV